MGQTMKYDIFKGLRYFSKGSKREVLFFINGVLFTLFMLTNVLYALHPYGGWVTEYGVISTSSILLILLVSLSLSLFALWFNVNKRSSEIKANNKPASVIKTQNAYSPIDFPKGRTQAVVSGYAVA